MFPSDPNVDDEFTTADGRVFKWDGTRWVLKESGGDPGSSGQKYTHTQAAPDRLWDIVHNLEQRLVLVQVVSSAGKVLSISAFKSGTHRSRCASTSG